MNSYKERYLKYKNKYIELKNYQQFIQKGGAFNNFKQILDRFETRPDRILLYTTQLPQYLTSSNKIFQIYNGSGQLLDQDTSLHILSRKFDKPIHFIDTDRNKKLCDLDINMSDLETKILPLNRPEAEQILLTNANDDQFVFLLRPSSIPGFIALSYIFNRAMIHSLVKIQNITLYPYLNTNRDRNPAFFEKYEKLRSEDNPGMPGMTAITIKEKLSSKGPLIPIEIVFNTDKEEYKVSKFDELTNKSLVFIISHCCNVRNELLGNYPEYTTQDLNVVSNPNITHTYLKTLLLGKKDLIIVLWACSGNRFFSIPLMKELKENIIISRREPISRLGGLRRDDAGKIVSDFICGRDSQSYITLWNKIQDEEINIPTKFLNITSRYFV